MRAARLVLVLILLSAMTRAGEAQLLPGRRVAVRVGNRMAEFGARVTMEAMDEGLKQAKDELGDALDLQLSVELYAQIQMSPQARLPLKRGTEQDRPRQDCLSLLLAETARLAARLEEEKFSPPVLEKMVLDYQGIPLSSLPLESTQEAGHRGRLSWGGLLGKRIQAKIHPGGAA